MQTVTPSFSNAVVLVDVEFLNHAIRGAKQSFETMIGRALPTVDLGTLALLIAAEAQVEKSVKHIQFVFVYDKTCNRLADCTPCNLQTELNGTAFQHEGVEYEFLSISPEEMVSREELFLDTLSILADSKEVKDLVILPHVGKYGDHVDEYLKKVSGKHIVQLGLLQPHVPVEGVVYETLVFVLKDSLGVFDDEIPR